MGGVPKRRSRSGACYVLCMCRPTMPPGRVYLLHSSLAPAQLLGCYHGVARNWGAALLCCGGFALLPHGMIEWNLRIICCRTRDFRSRYGACRGLPRHWQAPPLAHTPGAHRTPGLPALSPSRTSSHATFSFARRVPCRLRSRDPSACRGVGLFRHEQILFS